MFVIDKLVLRDLLKSAFVFSVIYFLYIFGISVVGTAENEVTGVMARFQSHLQASNRLFVVGRILVASSVLTALKFGRRHSLEAFHMNGYRPLRIAAPILVFVAMNLSLAGIGQTRLFEGIDSPSHGFDASLAILAGLYPLLVTSLVGVSLAVMLGTTGNPLLRLIIVLIGTPSSLWFSEWLVSQEPWDHSWLGLGSVAVFLVLNIQLFHVFEKIPQFTHSEPVSARGDATPPRQTKIPTEQTTRGPKTDLKVVPFPLPSTNLDGEGIQSDFTPADVFDVFLSYNGNDKSEVLQLGTALQNRQLRVWLDEWELRPGLTWQDALERIISDCRAAAVCVGSRGIGPWEEPEMQALLRRFVNEKQNGKILPVIPVLLPNAPEKVKLPLFLEAFTWVDLRGGLKKENLDRLAWGITGVRTR